jgi:NADH-quinone oxidoreductase subunit G
MPTLTIDGRTVEVATGTKVIEAAERLGIVIPRFCYHPALGSVGACRVCAVGFLEGPVRGVQMSCMIDAQDGMVVSTTDPEATDFRRHVIEWLMMNHPHDCPVCDEGGHCLLQEETISGGHGLRRYLGKKRTYRDQDLGPLVQHEMNRCIHCYRCRRFYQDYAGYRDLGALQIASRTYFGRFADGPLESPFAGNLIDVCPTGVFTDKPSRFKGRRWDFERAPSICLECSLGCSTVVSARYREIVRIEAGVSEDVNGHFICDRGRYGFAYANRPDRPRAARIDGAEVPIDEALAAVSKRLAQFPPEAVALVCSPRSTVETLEASVALADSMRFRPPAFFRDPGESQKVRAAVASLAPTLAVSLREVEHADFILVVGADPLSEAPMLALALRQAFRRGARVAVLDPRPVSLPLDFVRVAIAPDEIDGCLGDLVGQTLRNSSRITEEGLQDVGDSLVQARRPVVVCGTDVVLPTSPAAAAELARSLEGSKESAGLFYVLPGPNAFAAALLDRGESILRTVEAIEAGDVRALLVVEGDPFVSLADRSRVESALRQLEFLLVLDHVPSVTSRIAQAFLPTSTAFEAGGWFVNQEGRAQRAGRVHGGGEPLSQTSAGEHPPRRFRLDVPGGEPEPAHALLDRLAALLGCGRSGVPWVARLADGVRIFAEDVAPHS